MTNFPTDGSWHGGWLHAGMVFLAVGCFVFSMFCNKIKNIQKVSGFLGPEGKPISVPEKEIEKIINQINQSEINPLSGITFEIGEKVKVCDGPFASFSGLVEEIDEEKLRLKVSVLIFGRPTPVDLDFNQVEKS